jgi:hypothetical protein
MRSLYTGFSHDKTRIATVGRERVFDRAEAEAKKPVSKLQ